MGLVRQEVNLFLVDRQSRGLSVNTIDCFKRELEPFICFLESQGIIELEQIRSDDIRSFFIEIGKKRNSGGIHLIYRVLRAFLNWWGEETQQAEWKNPMLYLTQAYEDLAKAHQMGSPVDKMYASIITIGIHSLFLY